MAKNFKDLSEAEILALAISNEESDGRFYADFAVCGSRSRSLKRGNRVRLFSSIAKSDVRAVAMGGWRKVPCGMKTNGPAIIALLLWLLFVASNAFAMFKPPYPHKTEPPDQIIVISDSGGDSIAGTATKPKRTIPREIKK